MGTLDWPKDFRLANGRAPRILHICNVANYAYVNARLMRRVGVEADVIDPDFFHFAAAPEWIDADIDGNHGDDFYPNWRGLNLNGYRRPEWFIQGPSPILFPYLVAKNKRDVLRAILLRRMMDAYRKGLGSPTSKPSLLRAAVESPSRHMTGLKSFARSMFRGISSANVAGPSISTTDSENVPSGALPTSVAPSTIAAALSFYDVVQGYTLGARFAAASRHPAYVACELGTLRGLPFEDSPDGRLCAWTYRSAPAVMVTNVDCLGKARELGIADCRLHPVLHPFDVDDALEFCWNNRRDPASPPYFFAPARHHWKDGNSSWLKGNDIAIRGAALAARLGHKFHMVFVEWGNEVHLSKQLIASEGIADRVLWIRPEGRRKLWHRYFGSIAVIDQFAARGFGGITLESLALARRVVTSYSCDSLRSYFSTDPPVFDATTPEMVADAMIKILADPYDEAGIGREGQSWVKREHAVERQLEDQFAIYAKILGERGSPIGGHE